ncbi:hypothetical protein BDK51DRAFT_45029 [Blyttiomyces helicus]|uniref:Uncharacterized protein n=1 Tax=Blyttiomyces helicus TaxID=388810 RepID=A0A4P9VWS5_9FUNG|nr:hypothetical protein BDK51DRAFT_45029 [Blyttiomyces helicus]|eukprot:RKO84154.1 hypothetical protein BDK51DRAFT_45029 [Blyttiomyces helicus]
MSLGRRPEICTQNAWTILSPLPSQRFARWAMSQSSSSSFSSSSSATSTSSPSTGSSPQPARTHRLIAHRWRPHSDRVRPAYFLQKFIAVGTWSLVFSAVSVDSSSSGNEVAIKLTRNLEHFQRYARIYNLFGGKKGFATMHHNGSLQFLGEGEGTGEGQRSHPARLICPQSYPDSNGEYHLLADDLLHQTPNSCSSPPAVKYQVIILDILGRSLNMLLLRQRLPIQTVAYDRQARDSLQRGADSRRHGKNAAGESTSGTNAFAFPLIAEPIPRSPLDSAHPIPLQKPEQFCLGDDNNTSNRPTIFLIDLGWRAPIRTLRGSTSQRSRSHKVYWKCASLAYVLYETAIGYAGVWWDPLARLGL